MRDKTRKNKQLFSFGRKSELSEKELRSIGDQVMKRLDDGDSLNDTIAWAKAECSA